MSRRHDPRRRTAAPIPEHMLVPGYFTELIRRHNWPPMFGVPPGRQGQPRRTPQRRRRHRPPRAAGQGRHRLGHRHQRHAQHARQPATGVDGAPSRRSVTHMAATFTPKPGSVADRAIAYLQSQPAAGTEVSSAALAEAIGAPLGSIVLACSPRSTPGWCTRARRAGMRDRPSSGRLSARSRTAHGSQWPAAMPARGRAGKALRTRRRRQRATTDGGRAQRAASVVRQPAVAGAGGARRAGQPGARGAARAARHAHSPCGATARLKSAAAPPAAPSTC